MQRWIRILMAPHTNMPIQAGLNDSSKFGGSEAGLGLVMGFCITCSTL